MVELETTTFSSIDKNTDRPVVLFGSGNIAKKTLKQIKQESVSFIVDNSKNLQGGTYEGYDIRPPKEITADHFIIITSTAIVDISGQLNSLGFEPHEDYAISPVLNDRIAISELEQLEAEFYFTSGAISSTDMVSKYGNSKYGGGLFRCELHGLDYDYEQIYQGPCYGSIRHEESILFIDTDAGLMKYDDGNVSLLTDLPTNSRPHGLSHNHSDGHIYVACSYQDRILRLNESFEVTNKYLISDKIKHTGEAMHHCNDCLAVDNSLYVTMFSSSGNWKKDSYDGCLTEFNIDTGERLRDVQSNLWMPHNVDLINGSLHVLDSLTGELRYNNLTTQGSFPAFSRGLSYHEGRYFIGQSKNRNHSKVIGADNTVSIDCGVVIFDPEVQISRFLHFPDVAGIHSITH